jgi:hypothetical protein
VKTHKCGGAGGPLLAAALDKTASDMAAFGIPTDCVRCRFFVF